MNILLKLYNSARKLCEFEFSLLRTHHFMRVSIAPFLRISTRVVLQQTTLENFKLLVTY